MAHALRMSEFVVSDAAGGHAKFGEHLGAGLDHHRGSAEVVFHGLRIGMILEVLFQDHLVDESLQSVPGVLRKWCREGKME